MMVITDINWLSHVVAALLTGVAITLLFFLKSSPQARIIPSVMLWSHVVQRSPNRKLGRFLSRFLHLLCLLFALFLLTCALLGVTFRSASESPLVVVADPRALPEAIGFYRSLPVSGRSLIISQAQPRRSDLKAAYETCQTPGNSSEAMALAVRSGGKVLFFGPSAPAWLPPDGDWVKCGEPGADSGMPEVRVFSAKGPVSGYDGWTWDRDESQSDLILDEGADEGRLLELTEPLQGTYADGLQHVKKEPMAAPSQRGALGLEECLWLCGLALIMVDLLFWLKKKVL